MRVNDPRLAPGAYTTLRLTRLSQEGDLIGLRYRQAFKTYPGVTSPAPGPRTYPLTRTEGLSQCGVGTVPTCIFVEENLTPVRGASRE